MKPTKISFELRYGDDSGVEFGVNYDSTNSYEGIKLEHVNSISWPIEKLQWLIDALEEIKEITFMETDK